MNRNRLETMDINPDIYLFIPEVKRVFSVFFLFLFCCLQRQLTLVLHLFTSIGSRKVNKQKRNKGTDNLK